MGMFDSIYVKCPHCGQENEEQFKPDVYGNFSFPEDVDQMPIVYLRALNMRTWECWSCNKSFRTKMNLRVEVNNPQVIAVPK